LPDEGNRFTPLEFMIFFMSRFLAASTRSALENILKENCKKLQ
jgi:hypothetical protein